MIPAIATPVIGLVSSSGILNSKRGPAPAAPFVPVLAYFVAIVRTVSGELVVSLDKFVRISNGTLGLEVPIPTPVVSMIARSVPPVSNLILSSSADSSNCILVSPSAS